VEWWSSRAISRWWGLGSEALTPSGDAEELLGRQDGDGGVLQGALGAACDGLLLLRLEGLGGGQHRCDEVEGDEGQDEIIHLREGEAGLVPELGKGTLTGDHLREANGRIRCLCEANVVLRELVLKCTCEDPSSQHLVRVVRCGRAEELRAQNMQKTEMHWRVRLSAGSGEHPRGAPRRSERRRSQASQDG
jgi:hypothetical protein